MADGEVSRKVKAVSAFLQKSCRQRTTKQFSLATVFRGCSRRAVHPVDRCKCKMFIVTSGSAAEFYIEPMLSCVGDTDIMYHYSNELAIPAWYPPPSQLPTDFESRVKVYEIVDSHLPGYVYLNLTYVLTRDGHDGTYKIDEHVRSQSNTLNHRMYVIDDNEGRQHGPARMHVPRTSVIAVPSCMNTDTVPCIHCFVWPPQASDFQTRNRNCDWPDAATVDSVIRQGCDVVGVAHRQCKQDEWMSKHQWRLSFSRAEILLLNSWMPVQQIVYHMLRIFVKTERLTDSAVNCEAVTLSNYHIKTLMLWACELKPHPWWNDGSSLVTKCLQMLQFLVEWLTKNRGQHYFVNDMQFVDDFEEFSLRKITAIVRSTTEDSLAQWFVDNYIQKCAEMCPDNILLMRSDITDEMLDGTPDAILQWRDYVSSKTMVKGLVSYFICCMLSLDAMSPYDCSTELSNMLTIALHFMSYFTDNAENTLDVVFKYLLPYGQIDFLNLMPKSTVTNAITSAFINASACHSVAGSSADKKHQLRGLTLDFNELCRPNVSPFRKAVTMMEFFANKHSSTREMTFIETAKVYLQLTLTHKDCDHDSMYCLVNVYMAVLHYTTGQYRKAIDHCTLVTRSQDHVLCNLNVVQGKLLPKIDDDIDNALGLTVFYQYVRAAAMNQPQQKVDVNVFTAEMFAHYFSIKHLLVARYHLMPKQSAQSVELHLREETRLFYNTMMSAPRLLVSDLMLCKLPSNRIVNTAYDCNSGSSDKRQLEILMTLSIQQLLTYRHLPGHTVSDLSDFLALYLYRCHLYERCDHVCRQAISELIDAEISRIPLVSTSYHHFIQLMDDKVVSLVGLTVLVDRTRAKSWFKEPITITQLSLSLYLLTKCQHPSLLRDADTLSALAAIMDWIVFAQKKIPVYAAVDHLILKLTERLAVYYINAHLNDPNRRQRRHLAESMISLFTNAPLLF